MSVLLTITPNPSLDLLFEHDRLVWDDANRMADPRRRPGGQGVNVARAARALGGDAIALTLLGGPTGAELKAALDAEGTRCHATFAADETRTFVAVRERATGRSMLLNARGPARSPQDAMALEQLFDGVVGREHAAWVAGCGSLPSAFPTDFYARVAQRAHAAHTRFVADCDGEPLRLAISAGCDLLVPNQHEAARLLGQRIEDVPSSVRAARQLRELSAGTVAITLGPAGAVIAHELGCWHAQPPTLDAGSAVGAGDAFLAALLLHLDEDEPAHALAHAVATGTATLLAREDTLLHPADVQRLLPEIRVTRLH